MPKTSQNRSKSRLGRLLGASRTGVGNELEKGNLGIIELGGFGTPKIDSRSTPEGFKKPSKFHSFFDIVSARFRGLLRPNMAPKIHQNPLKIDVDIGVYLGALLTSDFHRTFVRK